ncbi:unnamed protein product [Sphagnum balticum]
MPKFCPCHGSHQGESEVPKGVPVPGGQATETTQLNRIRREQRKLVPRSSQAPHRTHERARRGRVLELSSCRGRDCLTTFPAKLRFPKTHDVLECDARTETLKLEY